MGEWTIELEGPPRFGEEGPYWVGRFTVSDGLAESKSVQLTLTQHAEIAFARAAKAQPMGPELLQRIMAKCAEEQIEELLDGGKELPTELSVEGYPGPDEAMAVTHVGAQLMLQRWGIDTQAAVAEPAALTNMAEPSATNIGSTDAGEGTGKGTADLALVVSEPAADAGNAAGGASSEPEVPGADEVDAAERALDDASAEVEHATFAQATDAEALLDSSLIEPEVPGADEVDAAERVLDDASAEVEHATFAQATDAEALLDSSLVEPEAPSAEQGDAAEGSLEGAADLGSDGDSGEDPTTDTLEADQDELPAAS